MTTLYHAEIAGLHGLAFSLGPSWLFVPTTQEGLYVLRDRQSCILKGVIPEAQAQYLRLTILEPLLAALHPPSDQGA